MSNPAKFWDYAANSYSESEQQFDEMHLKTLQYTKNYVKASDNVLDFGCATGTKAIELAGHVQQIQGIDISANMLALANNRAMEVGVQNVTFTQTSLADAPFQPETFDAVLAF